MLHLPRGLRAPDSLDVMALKDGAKRAVTLWIGAEAQVGSTGVSGKGDVEDAVAVLSWRHKSVSVIGGDVTEAGSTEV